MNFTLGYYISKLECLVIKMQEEPYRESAILIIIKIINKHNVFKKSKENISRII